MDENILQIAFVAFVLIVFIAAFILRRMTVDDIFSDDRASSMKAQPFPNKLNNKIQTAPQNTFAAPATPITGVDRSSSQGSKENLNKIGKFLSIIGAVMIFLPLPDTIHTIGWGIAVLGYILAKATASPKEKKSGGTQNLTAQKTRLLATKPEYQEAMRLLQADLKNPSISADDKQRRAVSHLESKGVPSNEATYNLRLLSSLLNQQKKN